MSVKTSKIKKFQIKNKLTAKSDRLPICFPDIGSMFPNAIAKALT